MRTQKDYEDFFNSINISCKILIDQVNIENLCKIFIAMYEDDLKNIKPILEHEKMISVEHVYIPIKRKIPQKNFHKYLPVYNKEGK